MHARVAPAVVLALLVAGCSHRAVLPFNASPDEYESVNGALRDRNADIVLGSGQLHRCADVEVAPDSLRGRLRDSAGDRLSVPTSEVAKIKMTRRGRGALEGLAIGLVAGGILGLVAGPTNGGECAICASGRGEAAAFGAVAWASWGLVIGAIRGSRYEYSFAPAR